MFGHITAQTLVDTEALMEILKGAALTDVASKNGWLAVDAHFHLDGIRHQIARYYRMFPLPDVTLRDLDGFYIHNLPNLVADAKRLLPIVEHYQEGVKTFLEKKQTQ